MSNLSFISYLLNLITYLFYFVWSWQCNMYHLEKCNVFNGFLICHFVICSNHDQEIKWLSSLFIYIWILYSKLAFFILGLLPFHTVWDTNNNNKFPLLFFWFVVKASSQFPANFWTGIQMVIKDVSLFKAHFLLNVLLLWISASLSLQPD